MLGTGTFAEPTFRALLGQSRHTVVGLVTQPDREAGRKAASTRQVGEGMTTLARAAGVPVYQPESINTPEGVDQLRAWRADLLVTAAYGQILKADVLESARLGGINVHGSLLPRYRGAAPVAWAIWRGERETGVTIIRMTAGLDAGAMLARAAVEIGAQETAGELEARLAPLGAGLALDIIDRLASGPVTGEQQDPALVTKAPKLKKEHGAIDWTQPAEVVDRQIRAVQPWPTPYTFLHRPDTPGLRLLVLAGTPTADDVGPPGTLRFDAKTLTVGTGTGSLLIHEVQPAGKKRMPVAAWLNGRPLRPGDRFGPEQI
ncbi:MAG: methionyl-tRNA formyltransferase [Gemmataceae bacterium]|nr:methionyl-tRNA formyltransferase [Gemmataceae bacterium]